MVAAWVRHGLEGVGQTVRLRDEPRKRRSGATERSRTETAGGVGATLCDSLVKSETTRNRMMMSRKQNPPGMFRGSLGGDLGGLIPFFRFSAFLSVFVRWLIRLVIN